MRIYVLWHTTRPDPDGGEDSKLLGLYSTEARARDRIHRCQTVPGFAEYPDGFVVDSYEVDKDEWTEGFVTVSWPEE
jgi:hypothetical protein